MNLIYENQSRFKKFNLSDVKDVSEVIFEELHSVMDNDPSWWNSKNDPISDVCSFFYLEDDEGFLPESRSQLVHEIKTSFLESINL